MKMYKSSQYNIAVCENDHFTILYNCYSGGIIKLENEIYKKIKNSNFLLNDIKYGKELLENGFIVNKQVNEFNKVKMKLEAALSDKWQESVLYVIAPTLNCNLNCVYCFQKDFRTYENSNTITDVTLQNIKTFIVNNSINKNELKKIKINWFGGEPLLCYNKIIDFCKSIINELAKYNIEFECAMITNGVLLNENRLKALTTTCNLRNIQITLDGEEKTYCDKKQTTKENFKKVIKNICLATKYLKTNVRVNADKENIDELLRISQSLYEMDVNKNNLNIHFAQLRDYEHQNCNYPFFTDLEYWQYKHKFYEQLKSSVMFKNKKNKGMFGFSCSPYCGLARKNNFVIDYLGNLYKCEHCIGDSNKIVGNVVDGLYYNNVYSQSMTVSIDERCSTCAIFPYCNYSRCSAMHGFAGKGTQCQCYDEQVNVIKEKVKKIIGEKKQCK